MAYEHAVGKDLSQNDQTTGLPGAVTGGALSKGDIQTRTVIVRGPLSVLESKVPAQGADSTDCGWVPAGFLVLNATLTSSDGEGTITIECGAPGSDSEESHASPTLITYEIDMVECQMDLVTHPKIVANDTALDECIKWLASDETQRYDNGNFFWIDADGVKQPVSQDEALAFCQAWMHGIRTFNRYYPVVTKESTYTRIPGLTMGALANRFSITGGKAKFAQDIGTFSYPDIQLDGFDKDGFFKSGDGYRTAGKKSWTRTEQWTWTPDGRESDFAWIYTELASGSGNNGGGAN